MKRGAAVVFTLVLGITCFVVIPQCRDANDQKVANAQAQAIRKALESQPRLADVNVQVIGNQQGKGEPLIRLYVPFSIIEANLDGRYQAVGVGGHRTPALLHGQRKEVVRVWDESLDCHCW